MVYLCFEVNMIGRFKIALIFVLIMYYKYAITSIYFNIHTFIESYSIINSTCPSPSKHAARCYSSFITSHPDPPTARTTSASSSTFSLPPSFSRLPYPTRLPQSTLSILQIYLSCWVYLSRLRRFISTRKLRWLFSQTLFFSSYILFLFA